VEKERFIDVLRHYSKITEEEALRVVSLRERYPYSQLLHALTARVSKDHDFINHSKELQLAAVYAADRSVLKEVMTLDHLLPARPSDGAVKQVVKSVPIPVSIPVSQPAVVAFSENITNVADQVMSDLEKLHQAKHNFERMFVDSTLAKTFPSLPSVIERVESESLSDSKQKESSKSRKSRIVELAKAMASARESEEVEDSVVTPKKKKELPAESFIEELATSKKEIEPENEKQKEQLEIIEQFIKTQPSISNAKDKVVVAAAGDLTSIKAGEFNDNVVSETLVEILIKQGKKDKAVEVLKKLIWKFPQKKAYFAAQIEELKSS
jgi:tetratricopeptide (TPR) repeat protein